MIYINLKTKCFHCLTLSYQFMNLPRCLPLSLLPPSCSLIHHPATSSCFIKFPCCFKCELVSKKVLFPLPEDVCVSGYPLLFSSHAALCQHLNLSLPVFIALPIFIRLHPLLFSCLQSSRDQLILVSCVYGAC